MQQEGSVLVTHCGAEKIARAALSEIDTPPSTPTFKPVAHYELVDEIDRQLQDRGWRIMREEYAVQNGGMTLFGVMDLIEHGKQLDNYGPDHCGRTRSLGLRTANDRSMSIQIAVGMRVFVCDNLAFSGSLIALKRKHTSGLNLPIEISNGLDRYDRGATALFAGADKLAAKELTVHEAEAMIYSAFRLEIMPIRYFNKVADTYFEAKTPDVEPRTAWGLHNAFTRHIKDLEPAPAFRANTKLGQYFGLVGEN